MSALASRGVRIELPPGWEGEIYSPEPERFAAGPGPGRVVVHAATFPLPPGRGDFGTGAVTEMRPGDILVILFEYGRDSSGTELFARRGLPLPLAPEDFAGNTMPRRVPRRLGTQKFFTAGGRAFCLHVIIAARVADPDLVEIVNGVVGTMSVG